MPTVREVLSRDDVPDTKASSHRQGLAVGETTLGLLGASSRLLDLLETPEDIPFLGHLIQREILYASLGRRRRNGYALSRRVAISVNGQQEPLLAESQLCQAFAYGRARIDRKDGRFHLHHQSARLPQ